MSMTPQDLARRAARTAITLDSIAGGSYPPFIFTPPVVTSIAPTSAAIGSAPVTVTVTGSGFLPYSTVYFNNGPEATTFVDETELTIEVDPSSASFPGTYPVHVQNATLKSNAEDFDFTGAARTLTVVAPYVTGDAMSVDATISGDLGGNPGQMNWGDASGPEAFVGPLPVTVRHTYASNGDFPVFANDSVGITSPTITVVIPNPTPLAAEPESEPTEGGGGAASAPAKRRKPAP